jgi:hypothetical protein
VIYLYLPEETAGEVSWVVISSKNAAKLRVENVLHLHSESGYEKNKYGEFYVIIYKALFSI